VRPLKVTLVRSRAIDPAVNKVAKALSENGHDVKLLIWDRLGNKQTENIDGYTLSRFGLKAPYDKVSIVFYLPFWWLYEFFFLLKHEETVIHACDLDTLIVAVFVKLIKKTKLCYTIYDFYADNLPNKFPRIFRKLISLAELFGIQFADILFLVDECRLEQVKGAKIKNIVYIYNSPPNDLNIKQKNDSNNGEELRIFYAGMLHKSRGLEYIIKAISNLDYARLTIAGAKSDKSYLESLQIDLNANIKYIGLIPYEKVIEKSMEADILLAFYDPSIPNNKYASPNKLFEAMMCGKPIILNSEVAASKIILEEECGIIVPYGNVNAIKEAINRLKNDPDLRKKLGENGRKAYETKYSWKLMEKRLLNAYKTLD
jgi:glycosyltransferase involved in cell wall biosynthesis